MFGHLTGVQTEFVLQRDVRLNTCWKFVFPKVGKSVDSVYSETKTQLKQKRSKGIGKDKVRKMLIRKEIL